MSLQQLMEEIITMINPITKMITIIKMITRTITMIEEGLIIRIVIHRLIMPELHKIKTFPYSKKVHTTEHMSLLLFTMLTMAKLPIKF